ncbi:hypothetical protein HC725_02995 [Vibrio sp. S17_S38]|uniref:hypothetical protein n=1 Tax=Vibrio sp. S17_S38 TaxID=2720229 RepID=UPI001681175D|nr:hypothetical protein [Vibrio sp. S17_S38]MBD1572250.1 hypothetical protein [Vibrio sp. S17_S38]
MRKLQIILFIMLLSGCGSLPQSPSSFPIAKIYERTALDYGENTVIFNFPTHGYVGDKMAIAANGAAGNRKALLEQMNKYQKIAEAENLPIVIVITSVNPELSKAIILGTLTSDSVNGNDYSNLRFVYAGKQENSNEIKDAMEIKGFKYGFMDIYNGF